MDVNVVAGGVRCEHFVCRQQLTERLSSSPPRGLLRVVQCCVGALLTGRVPTAEAAVPVLTFYLGLPEPKFGFLT